MQNIIIIIVIASLILVGGGMAISGGIDLCAGAQCQGQKALLESQAAQNNALANQTQSETEQSTKDHETFREHWSKWMTQSNAAWGGWLKTVAQIMQVTGWVIGLSSAWAFSRMASGAATGANIFFLLRGVSKGVAPVHQQRGKVSSVFFPTLNAGQTFHDDQPDIVTIASQRGMKQLQSGDAVANAARAMANAHRTRSVVQQEVPLWKTIWQGVLQWRSTRSSSHNVEVINDQEDSEFS